LCYKTSLVAVVMFSLTDSRSFFDVEDVWMKELRDEAPNLPVILVGTKRDMRRDRNYFQSSEAKDMTNVSKVISEEQGEAMANSIGAMAYVECSAVADNADMLFDHVFRASVKRINKLKGKIRHKPEKWILGVTRKHVNK